MARPRSVPKKPTKDWTLLDVFGLFTVLELCAISTVFTAVIGGAFALGVYTNDLRRDMRDRDLKKERDALASDNLKLQTLVDTLQKGGGVSPSRDAGIADDLPDWIVQLGGQPPGGSWSSDWPDGLRVDVADCDDERLRRLIVALRSHPSIGNGLVELKLSNSRVTDEGFAELRVCTELRRLIVDSRDGILTDEIFVTIGFMREVQVVQISSKQVRGSRLNELPGKIVTLELLDASLTSEAIRSLSLTDITSLALSGSGITDESLGTLKRLIHLRRLYLFGTTFSQMAEDELKAAISGLVVHRKSA